VSGLRERALYLGLQADLLEGNDLVGGAVLGLVDDTVSALTDLLNLEVVAETSACKKGANERGSGDDSGGERGNCMGEGCGEAVGRQYEELMAKKREAIDSRKEEEGQNTTRGLCSCDPNKQAEGSVVIVRGSGWGWWKGRKQQERENKEVPSPEERGRELLREPPLTIGATEAIVCVAV
jgi:hypothetical protein